MHVIKFKRNPFIKYAGNLLVVSFDDLSFSITGYENIRKEGSTTYEDLQPIPLTEEWLLKAEAIKIGRGDIELAVFWELMGVVFYELNELYYLPVGYQMKGRSRALITFDKVHELQALFDMKQTSIETLNEKQIG
ncbi:MAG: hypothetical protein V4608_11050 [Bacteroidota bacterium]